MASRVLGVFAVAATATIASLALATPASAHTPKVGADCVTDKKTQKVETKYWVNLSAYNGATVTVTVDGVVKVDKEKFQDRYDYSVKLDPTVPHKFSVVVKAFDNPKQDPGKYDFTDTRERAACVEAPPTKTSEPTKPTQPPVETPSSSVVPPSSVAVPPGGGAPEPPLAATGASPLWLLVSGVGLVGAGVGAIFLVRRRRA